MPIDALRIYLRFHSKIATIALLNKTTDSTQAEPRLYTKTKQGRRRPAVYARLV